MSARPRVALVVQRYGAEVNGGAEALARRVARLIDDAVDLTVLTTCALDYRTWADHYPPGEQAVDGVRVLRFPVPEPRDPEAFDRHRPAGLRRTRRPGARRRVDARPRGPDAPGLMEHLRDHGGGYDAVAFVTYLYATTAEGIGHVRRPQRSWRPTLHDEPPAAAGGLRPGLRRRPRC